MGLGTLGRLDWNESIWDVFDSVVLTVRVTNTECERRAELERGPLKGTKWKRSDENDRIIHSSQHLVTNTKNFASVHVS